MKKISKISLLHYWKLIFRSVLLASVLGIYIWVRVDNPDQPIRDAVQSPFVYGAVAIIFLIEMALRFFPSSMESMGCQKQFARNYKPTGESEATRSSRGSTVAVLVSWLLLNGAIGALYLTDIIDEGIMLIIALFYSVCDMICILYFCPFQTWFMKNKCCGTCRIYNWDYAMMFTPLAFVIHPVTLTLFGVSMALLLYWEICLRLHPERFSERTNDCLSCKNCKEKLCHHKTQLRHFLKKNKDTLLLKGNTVIGKVKDKLKLNKNGDGK